MAKEQDLINRIARAIPSGGSNRGGWLRLGIGDDAALVRAGARNDTVLSFDPFLEGVHFLLDVHSADSVGFKALARAASDLAAMGATPRGFLLGLALPARLTRGWLDGFLAGMGRAARRFGLHLAGGDVSRHPTVAISVTVIGEVARGRALTRSGARPGDSIFMSGTPGVAQLGLELVLRRMHRRSRWDSLLRRHAYPEPRIALGELLAHRRLASAAIDTSDGLSTDLARLCTAGNVGAVIWQDRLPRPRVPEELREPGLDPLGLALNGAEDYELLFTVPRAKRHRVPRKFGGIPLTEIGVITRSRGILLETPTGRETLPARGWDHFAREKPIS